VKNAWNAYWAIPEDIHTPQQTDLSSQMYCKHSFDAPIAIRWTEKTRTIPLLL